MQPHPLDALAAWHEFYSVLGAAAATLTGLLFVAASLGSGTFSADRAGALRVFLSASLVHFSGILAVCLIALAPIHSAALLGLFILGCGGFGLVYYAIAWRDLWRDGAIIRIDWEDRVWYGLLPALFYLLEAAAGVALGLRMVHADTLLAAALGLRLMVAIHNAWDMTVWSITRRRE